MVLINELSERIDNCIYYNNVMYLGEKSRIRNRSFTFKKLKDFQLPNEELKEKRIVNTYILNSNGGNLGHWFFECLFHIFHSYQKIPMPVIYKYGSNKFFNDFVESLFKKKDIIQFDSKTIYRIETFYNFLDCPDINRYGDYMNGVVKMRKTIFKHYNIIPDRKLNIFYDRGEMEKKRILNVDMDFITDIGFEKVTLLDKSFKETVELFSKVKNLITPEGAGVVNYLFLEKSCKVMEIHASYINSWAVKMGLDKNVNLKLFVTQNIKKSKKALSEKGLSYEQMINDSHTIFDEEMRNFIKRIFK